MALKGNGNLLIKARSVPQHALAAQQFPVQLPGYSLESLAPLQQSLRMALAPVMQHHWLLAKPHQAVEADPSPWDAAHQAAQANGYAHYVEPDIIHEAPLPPNAANKTPAAGAPPVGKLDGGMDPDWSPCVLAQEGVRPDWHLSSFYADFETAWKSGTGEGIRIGHLDTGYTPSHHSTPRNIHPELAYDFWDKVQSAKDPLVPVAIGLIGHGTCTLALLAGNAMDLPFGKHHYTGDVGGAPDADIVPVRISPSVAHVYTSTMARGIYYCLGPTGDPNKVDPAGRCDVISISHGGVPTVAWADAVNTLYEAGTVIVAASGDSIYAKIIDLATRYTYYPSAFNRVITAVGATYAKQPYITDRLFVMQECWGPDAVMEKAIAGFSPNVLGMVAKDSPDGFNMYFAGTSATTPQIAAACALWLAQYGKRLPPNWQRVEACRLALFAGADNTHPNKGEFGWGLLNVPRMLNPARSEKAIAEAKAGKPSAADSVSWPFWRLLLGFPPPDSDEERMYETEVAQIVTSSDNPELRVAAALATKRSSYSVQEHRHLLSLLKSESMSQALKAKIAAV